MPDILHFRLMRPHEPTLIRPASGNELPPPILPHGAYFAALADLQGQEESRAWRATVAGLVGLRLIDRWIACPRDSISDNERGVPAMSGDDLCPAALQGLVSATREATVALERTDVKRQSLVGLVEAASTGSGVDMARALLMYAHVLHVEAAWALAADVYETVYRLATAPGFANLRTLYVLAPVALERLGYCKRMMGDLDAAGAVYRHARGAAVAHGDGIRELRIRLSEANLLIHVGNLPSAVDALEAIIDAASQVSQTVPYGRELAELLRIDLPFLDIDIDARDVIALARHARGLVATMVGDHPLALEQCFAAWECYRDAARRERVWLDMAVTLSHMGMHDTAHDAYAVLHLTAREREVQLIAALNLMELGVMKRQADVVATYRGELERAAASDALPAALAPWVAFHSARAEARFGQPDRARHLFQKALELAERAHVNEVTIRTDAALAALAIGEEAEGHSQTRPVTPTPSITRIARTIYEVRHGYRAAHEPVEGVPTVPGL